VEDWIVVLIWKYISAGGKIQRNRFEMFQVFVNPKMPKTLLIVRDALFRKGMFDVSMAFSILRKEFLTPV